MKKSLAIVTALSLGVGCASKSKPDETETVEQTVEESAASEEPEETASSQAGGKHQHRHKHEHGGHRFDEPEKYAERWNDPTRDEWQKPDEVIELMGVEPGMTVADIGTGTGFLVPHLSEAVGAEGCGRSTSSRRW